MTYTTVRDSDGTGHIVSNVVKDSAGDSYNVGTDVRDSGGNPHTVFGSNVTIIRTVRFIAVPDRRFIA